MSELIKKKHSTKSWLYTYHHFVSNVKILKNSGNESPFIRPLIFHLPYKYLRDNRTSFCEFKKESHIIPFVTCFLSYLTLIQTINDKFNNPTSGTTDQSQRPCLYTENVRNVNGQVVAIRFYFFVSANDQGFLYKVVEGILKKNRERLKKMKPKLRESLRNTLEHQHEFIETWYDWMNMASTYRGNQEPLQSLLTQNDCVFKDPSMIFSMDNDYVLKGKYYMNKMEHQEQICEKQVANLKNYEEEIKVGEIKRTVYVFPVEEDILCLHPQELSIHEIFENKKYLPSYFMERMLLPRVVKHDIYKDNLSNNREKDEKNDPVIYFLQEHAHLHVQINLNDMKNITIFEFLNSQDWIQTRDNMTYQIVRSSMQRFEGLLRDYFYFQELECKHDTNLFYLKYLPTFSTHLPCLSKISEIRSNNRQDHIDEIMKGKSYNDLLFRDQYQCFSSTSNCELNWFGVNSSRFIEDPKERELLTDKHSLDAIDFLKYEAAIEKHNFDAFTFKRKMTQKLLTEVIKNPYADVSEPMKIILDWGNMNTDYVVKRSKYKIKSNKTITIDRVKSWLRNLFTEQTVGTYEVILFGTTEDTSGEYSKTFYHINLFCIIEGMTKKQVIQYLKKFNNQPDAKKISQIKMAMDSKQDVISYTWDHHNVFVNSINFKMNFFDNDLQVSTGHAVLMLLHHSKYDAYRQDTDLHFNTVFTGEGATSKSFLFEKMKQMSIPATVSELTYQTAKADAIDGDRNDTIIVFNESPPGLIMKTKKADPTQEAAFKEKLTSHRVSCKTFEKNEDTMERTNRKTISQCIGVHMGATNDDPSDATEAMKTRFFWGQFEKNERHNKTIDMCMKGEKLWNELGEEILNGVIKDLQMEHYRMALLFKMMYIGILPYPSLDVSDIVYFNLSKTLKRDFKLSTSTRFKERYDCMCRIYTMINALELVFNYETKWTEKKCNCGNEAHYGEYSPERCINCRLQTDHIIKNHYGKTFQAEYLLDTEPYLYCTEQIAIFVFTQLSSEIYNPNEAKIINALFQIVLQKVPTFKTIKNKDNSEIEDFNKLVLVNVRLETLVKYVHAQIPVELGKPSEHNIKSVIKSLSLRSIEHRRYVQKDANNSPWIKNDVLNRCTYTENSNEPHVVTDCLVLGEKGIELATELFKQPRIEHSRLNNKEISNTYEYEFDNMDSMYLNADQYSSNVAPPSCKTKSWFARGIIKEQTSDKMGSVIKSLQHKYTDNKYILFGMPRMGMDGKINTPNRFKATMFTNNERKIIEMSNPLYKNNEDLDIRKRKFVFSDESYKGELIEEDLDVYGCLTHFDKININRKFNNDNELNEERSRFLDIYLEKNFSNFYKHRSSDIEVVDTSNNYRHKYKGFKEYTQTRHKRRRIICN